MDSTKRVHRKRTDEAVRKSLSILSFASILLIVALFLRIEMINKRTQINELRILAVESRMRTTNELDGNVENKPKTFTDFESVLRKHPVDHYKRKKRNIVQSPTAGIITLQQIREEINNKFSKVCKSSDRICQAGPPGPPGAHGYPGYKGEKGASGKEGPPGPSGPIGTPGASGKRGPAGPQGVKGDKGDKGSIGAPGIRGETGTKGRQGQKGSIGLKGNSGIRGLVGIQGPKGECVVPPKIGVYPVSHEVFINETAIFFCWVQGLTSSKITWRKLGGTLSDATVEDGALRINSVQRSHVGSYMCTAHTGLGIFRISGRLLVKEVPRFTNKPPPKVVVEQGTTVTLCCVATGFPRPKVEWTRHQRSTLFSPLFQEDGCLAVNTAKAHGEEDYICRATNSFGLTETVTTVIATVSSCDQIQHGPPRKTDGTYYLRAKTTQLLFPVYCELTTDGRGWTLIARLSNNDVKNWMADTGHWWYDRQVATGNTNSPFTNTDMISPAFWMVRGSEFKITRSDDPSHTPLLQTIGNCLGGQTFRSKITSYGDFRNGKVWASNQCLGSCEVQYGGQYKSTDGFQQAECDGNIQSANKIGFWCDWSGGDGAVMMIGGGGGSCARADHGIGITESNSASFIEEVRTETEYDFGYDANKDEVPSQSYSLNLWIR